LADHLEYTRGWTAGVEFTRAARFPQFEKRQPLPDGPVTRAWLDGFAEGILVSRDDDAEAAQAREFCKRFRDHGQPAVA
jgi:hypothetical protein